MPAMPTVRDDQTPLRAGHCLWNCSFAVLIQLALAPASVYAEDRVDYLREIKPVLKERCYSCHGALQQKAKLRLDTAKLIRQGGRHGPAIKPGDPEGSLLLEKVCDPEEAKRMPPLGKPLTER